MNHIMLFLVLGLISSIALAENDNNWFLEVSAKNVNSYDENLQYLGFSIEKEVFSNISLGVSFFSTLNENERSNIDQNVFIQSYGGINVSYHAAITEDIDYMFSVFAGGGMAEVSKHDYDLRDICTCGISILEPMVKFNYRLSNQDQLSLALSSINLVSESKSFTSIGLSYRYGW